tara:strand:+ start:212 stop:499 length:288 start_codon:yes stop_codon:yes gene_type:complete
MSYILAESRAASTIFFLYRFEDVYLKINPLVSPCKTVPALPLVVKTVCIPDEYIYALAVPPVAKPIEGAEADLKIPVSVSAAKENPGRIAPPSSA